MLYMRIFFLYFFYKRKIKKYGYDVLVKLSNKAKVENNRLCKKKQDLYFLKVIKNVENIIDVIELKNPCIYKTLIAYHILVKKNYNIQIIVGVHCPPLSSHMWLKSGGNQYYNNNNIDYKKIINI